MSENQKNQFTPYIPDTKNIPEFTIKALILGAILSVIMGAANAYLGLKAGMTVSASIPAAVISMAILRGVLRRGTILENNTVQTMASTGESLAAGVIFTVPALVMIGEWQNFEFWPTTLITLLGGLLGIVFMVPMRKALIVERPDLVYPEGVACAEVLVTGEEGGSGIRSIVHGLVMGGVFKLLLSGVGLVKDTVEGATSVGKRVFYFGSDMSVALLAVGYIVNLEIAMLITLGGVIGWLVVIPILSGSITGDGPPLDIAVDLWRTEVRYIGVGTMLIGGLYSIWKVRHGIVAGVTGMKEMSAGSQGSIVKRTERNMPLPWLLGIFLLTILGTFAFYDYLTGSMGVAALTAGLMIFTSFLFVAVATYIAGLVGSSNSPVSGMTICALLISAGVMLALGIKGESAILATLGVAGVVCCATCTSGDVAQDLKTGLLVGATPARQQWAEIIACVVSAFTFAPILVVLHKGYGIGTGEPGSLDAPQAALFKSLTEGFFSESVQLPWNMIMIGAVIGLILILINNVLEAKGSRFRTHVMPVAVGIYLPLSLDIPILIGGLIRHFLSKRKNSPETELNDAKDNGVLFGSGLIAGEALMGILIGFLLWQNIETQKMMHSIEWFKNISDYSIVSLLIFGGIIYTYIRVVRKQAKEEA